MALHKGTGPVDRHDDTESAERPGAGGAPMRRPWQVRVGVVVYAVWWLFVSIRLVQQGSYSGGALAGATVWTLITVLVLYRVWRGGPVARWLLHQFGVGVGAVLGLGIALLFWTMAGRPDGIRWDFGTITGPLVAVVPFGAGLLFGTAPARAWCPGSHPGRR